MSTDADSSAGAVARHHIANLLYTYIDIADRKDVAAAVDLLGAALVRFPHAGYDSADAAPSFFTGLWAAPTAHRHDVTNLQVHRDRGDLWRADAHYTRWIIAPDPVLHTLGRYTLTVDSETWSINELIVDRTWTRG